MVLELMRMRMGALKEKWNSQLTVPILFYSGLGWHMEEFMTEEHTLLYKVISGDCMVWPPTDCRSEDQAAS